MDHSETDTTFPIADKLEYPVSAQRTNMQFTLNMEGKDSPSVTNVHQTTSDSVESSRVSSCDDHSIDLPLRFKEMPPRSLRLIRSMTSESECSVTFIKSDLSVTPQPEAHDVSTSEFRQHCGEIKAFKSKLKTKFQCLREVSTHEHPKPLNEIYTELYIIEGGEGKINDEHEVRWIEKAFRKAATGDAPINLNDIFTPLPGQDQPIRTVLTKGVAGIGKTVSVQKFILDWTEEKANQDVHLIFPLPFRELNLLKDQIFSLQGLLQFFMSTKQLEFSLNGGKIIFIFDGLDECHLSLDFQNNVSLCDVNESASVNVLLTNLIVGNLLPSALIWITSRPAAADRIPFEHVHRLTEVRGFNDPQKEEYFEKRIRDEILAGRIISHLKSSRSLYIMCHIPVFCWISATVLEKMLSQTESEEIPKTLTQMYTHFLILQTTIKHEKDYKMEVNDEDIILKLGKLAFQQLKARNLIFYEEDLRECGIIVTEASVYSGMLTQIFRELGVDQRKVYCFVHQSIQEYLAALYVHMSFIMKNINMLCSTTESFLSLFTKNTSMFKMHLCGVKKALKSENGHWDLFLRFLLGLSLESNQILLQSFLTDIRISSYDNKEIVAYIKNKIVEYPSPEKSFNLFHCLNELNDDSLVAEIQQYLKSETMRGKSLQRSQWSALTFLILISEQKLDVFDLGKYAEERRVTDDILLRLLPVIEASRVAELDRSKLTYKCCGALASTLSSKSSCLRELYLGQNNLQDAGVKMLCVGLRSADCKLETLGLNDCRLTEKCCEDLSSIFSTESSSLKVLDLNGNNLQDSGVKLLSSGLASPHCKVVDLSLWNCGFTNEGCAALASALTANPSHLIDLSLSGNEIGDSGAKLLSRVLENPACKLESLWLKICGITYEGCAVLVEALKSNPSHLKVLSLYGNEIGASGKKLLTDVKDDETYKLDTIEYGSVIEKT
ncbi:NLR family CARD domain-containing protein 3 [Labeo rohita]|uniref:NLR family CARD domain-containing protein 3 n=1 Tax=Labeo rohita TaxID=84645 RepID=A0ABQ8M0I4_LABRO|nr:NLR family CARD domain-containing protein 3 [Labeo rohita]